MLSGRIPTAGICLRCQYRLALRHQQSTVRQFSAEAVRRAPSSSDLRFQDQVTSTRDHAKNHQSDRGFKWKHFSPQGRIRGRKGKETREESAALGVNSLGAPAEVLILRDVDIKQDPEIKASEPVSKKSKKEGEADTKVGLSSQGPVYSAEVKQAIDQIRPDDDLKELPPAQSRKRILAIANKLRKGFLNEQLEEYIENFKDETPGPSTGTLKYFSADKRSLWTRNTYRLSQRIPLSMGIGKNLSKDALVEHIIHNCWKCVSVEQPGQIEIYAKSWHVALLQQDQSLFQRLQSSLGARAHIIPDSHNSPALRATHANIIRIEANEEASQRAIQVIDDWLANCTVSFIELEPFAKRLDRENSSALSLKRSVERRFKAEMRAICDMTNSYIGSAMGKNYDLTLRSTTLEGNREAQRLVYSLLLATQEKNSCIASVSEKKGAVVLQPFDTQAHHSKRLREAQLGRLVMSQPKFTYGGDQPKPTPPPQDLTLQVEQFLTGVEASKPHPSFEEKKLENLLLDTFDEPEDPGLAYSTGAWRNTMAVSVDATIGHVLHHPPTTSDAKGLLRSLNGSHLTSERPIFIPSIPRLGSILTSLPLAGAGKAEGRLPSLKFELMPMPSEVDGLSTENAPRLAVKLRQINYKKRQFRLAGLHAVVDSQNLDVLRPAHMVDLRVSKSTFLESFFRRSSRVENRLPFLQAFIDGIQNLFGGGLLYAPPYMDVPLPRWVLDPKKEAPKDDSASETVTVRYRYTSVKLTESVGLGHWEGFPLEYVTTNAGRLRGTTAELRLIMGDRAGDKITRSSDAAAAAAADPAELTKSFTNAVFSLVDMVHSAQLRPRTVGQASQEEVELDSGEQGITDTNTGIEGLDI